MASRLGLVAAGSHGGRAVAVQASQEFVAVQHNRRCEIRAGLRVGLVLPPNEAAELAAPLGNEFGFAAEGEQSLDKLRSRECVFGKRFGLRLAFVTVIGGVIVTGKEPAALLPRVIAVTFRLGPIFLDGAAQESQPVACAVAQRQPGELARDDFRRTVVHQAPGREVVKPRLF